MHVKPSLVEVPIPDDIRLWPSAYIGGGHANMYIEWCIEHSGNQCIRKDVFGKFMLTKEHGWALYCIMDDRLEYVRSIEFHFRDPAHAVEFALTCL